TNNNDKPTPPAQRVYTNETYQNPLRFHKQDGSEYYVAVADPDIYRDDESGYFYMYCTNTQCEMGDKGMMYDRGPIFRSSNLVDWTWVGSVFDGHSDALNWHDKNAGVWAPSVIKVGNRYNYYYSLSLWGDENPGIGVATAPTPYGPWTHYGKLLDQKMTGVRNGIDPQPFYVGDDLYLIWGSFFGIACTLLTDDGTELFYGDEVKQHITYLIDDNTEDGQMNVDINYEGSYVISRNDKFYYFGSQGTCLNSTASTYRVRVGVCNKFGEKFTTHDGITLDKEPYGEEVISPSEKVAGVGHNTVVQDFAGDYWLFYHGYDVDGPFGDRIVFLDKLLWDENGMPYVEGRQASIGQNKLGPTIVKF
ncbi:MAG: family 43 glycosylhydrolase, partial [Candidatus Fimimonas sp.]